MNNPLFPEVREAISKWVKSNDETLKSNNISLEILRDNDTCFRVELNFGKFLAEILVEEPWFAPYRYMSFQAVGIINGVPDLLYFWYDEKNMNIDKITENLDKTITVCINKIA